MLNGIWGFFFDWRNSDGRVSGQNGYGDGAILSGGRSAVELALAMAGVISVWSGVLKIAEQGGMIDRLAARLTPLMDFLFPPCRGCILQENISQRIFVANFLGFDGRQHLPD